MAKSSFKLEHPLERRQAEAARIREKYQDRIPIIVERANTSDVPDIDKKKSNHLEMGLLWKERNGDTYAGEYFEDKMHGFGVYCFANGHQYEGAWHEGRRQGPGMYTFRSGETQFVHWQNGILNVPSTRNNTYPVSPVAVYRSKVLNAVQEARRAAEKAYDVAKVDERVNKAVASANRAADAARVIAVKAAQKQMDHNHNNNNAV